MNILKAEGHKFPEFKESDAMFLSDTAPDWAEGDVCNRCRVGFSLTNRRHHCRNCGQVFCGKCSSKTSTIPKYGIEKDVRVCDACYTQLQKPSTGRPARTSTSETDLPAEYLTSSLAQQSQGPPKRSEQELQEEEELQLALALSQSEAEQQKSKVGGPYSRPKTFAMVRDSAATVEKRPSPEPLRKSPSPVEPDATSDPELARYLNRSYWENRKTTDSPTSPSAPSPALSQITPTAQMAPIQAISASGMKIMPEDPEIDDFAGSMKTQLDVFVNRMKSNSSRGRSISTDSSVQTLFLTMTSLHSTLLNYTKTTDDKRLWYEQLQDKLNQIRDSRAALDVLRQEHQEKLRRQAEEAERMRQYQMAQKLEIMRKKKQEYLQYQRQIALQRIQEQEREMQLRQEQQKAQYRIGAQGFPYMGGPGMPPPHPNGHSGSPIHQQIPGMYGNFNYPGQMVPPGVLPRMGPGGMPVAPAPGHMGLMYGSTQPGMPHPQSIHGGGPGVMPQPGMTQPGGAMQIQQQAGSMQMQQPGQGTQGIPQNQGIHPQQQQQQAGMAQQQMTGMPQQYQQQIPQQAPLNQPPQQVVSQPPPPQQQQQQPPPSQQAIQQPAPSNQPAPPQAEIPKPQAPPAVVSQPSPQPPSAAAPQQQPAEPEAVVETAELISFD